MFMSRGDSALTCPYNMSHTLLRSRMQTHLVKCEKEYLNTPGRHRLLKCMFNANHHVPGEELLKHMKGCPDYGSYSSFTITVGEGSRIPYNQIILPPSTESWDNSPHVPTYDPLLKILSKPIVRQIPGANRADRRKFHKDERERFTRIRDDEIAAAKNGSAVKEETVPMSSVETHAYTDAPLRMPRGKSLATNSQLGQGRGRVTSVPPDVNIPGVGGATSHDPNSKGCVQSSSSSTSSTREYENGSGPNRGCNFSNTQIEELVETTAELEVTDGENEKKKKAPWDRPKQNGQIGHNNAMKTDFPALPSRGRGKFVRKK